MTTDLQRMRQDEWAATLRSGEYTQVRGELWPGEAFGRFDGTSHRVCAVGAAYRACDYDPIANADRAISLHLGVSDDFLEAVVDLNDHERLSFGDIADWIKEQRDSHDGDLSGWKRPS